MVRTASPALTESTESSTMEAAPTTRTENLWAELQQIQQQEMDALKQQRDALEQEKEAMNTMAPDGGEIVTINAGGECIIQTTRDTICLAAPGTRFACLFSGRWENHVVKDAQGRIFLDHDPELIRLVVNYLRTKRLADPNDPPLDPPIAPKGKRREWFYLLKHYGLTALFTKYSLLDVAKITVVQPHGSLVSTQQVGDSLHLTVESRENSYFVACTPCLVPSTPSSWKVTINQRPSYNEVFLGWIGKTSAPQYSHNDPTSFGWTWKQVYFAGSCYYRAGNNESWTGFTEGECLHFCFDGTKLTMFSVIKNQYFVIDNIPAGGKFIHFNFSRGATKVTLEPLAADEYAKLMAV
jgi:hypothetical protein